MIGRTLGHYEVVSKLGEGGMGEVYRAHDRRLGRDVALKVLPERLAGDLDRLARFEREARAVAALDHPHIAKIHGIEEDGGRRFLVLECVEGETLAERLARGPLPLEEVLEIGIQLASGLEAAHAAGVIHRDLKPGNLKITPQGKLKILDFGLAKISPELGASDLAHSPTLSYAGTEAGLLLGTASYMSPQQATGKPVDKRADLWAFGCVLYECLCGRKPFAGETTGDILAAILRAEPDWERLPAATPPSVRRLLHRCLAKDPAHRLHDAADARLELEEAAREPLSAPPAAGAPARGSRVWLRWLGWALAGALGIALAVTTLRTAPSKGPASAPFSARYDVRAPPGVEISGSPAPATLAISRDGRQVAFRAQTSAGESYLYVRALDELEARRVAGSEGAWNPFFSPDGAWLGFVSRGALRRAPLAGGDPLAICEAARVRGASWGEDGTIVFSNGEGLLSVPADGGSPAVLTAPPATERGVRHYWPHHLPGGKAILFDIHQGGKQAAHELAVLRLDGSEPTGLVRGGSYPRYAGGQLVFARLGTLFAAPFDPERLALTGPPRSVLDDVYFYQGSYFVSYDLSKDGALVYSPGAPRVRDSEIVRLDRSGAELPVAARRGAYRSLGLSPDGQRLAVFIEPSLEEADLWVHDAPRELWSRLTTHGNAASDSPPLWSPDGRWIVYSALADGAYKVFRIRADGSGAAEQITTGGLWDQANAISPDGRTLLFQRQTTAAQWDLLTLELEGDRAPRAFLATPVLEARGDFSPDGRWIVYEADDSGQREIYARPFPAGEPKVTLSNGGGWIPKWSSTGSEIVFRCGPNGLGICALDLRLGADLAVGRSERLFDLPAPEGTSSVRFVLSADGREIYLPRPVDTGIVERRLVFAPAWIDELAAR